MRTHATALPEFIERAALQGGDHGRAFEGLQRRQDRHVHVRTPAQQAGEDWTASTIRAQYRWNELDGRDGSRDAHVQSLKGARTLGEANSAKISALHPASWNAQNPKGGYASQQRLANAREIFARMTGGNAHEAPAGSADVLVPNVMEMSSMNPGDAQPQQPLPSWETFRQQVSGSQKPWSLQQALDGIAVAAIARSNLSAAAVYTALIQGVRDKLSERNTSIQLSKKSSHSNTFDRYGRPVESGKVEGWQIKSLLEQSGIQKCYGANNQCFMAKNSSFTEGSEILQAITDCLGCKKGCLSKKVDELQTLADHSDADAVITMHVRTYIEKSKQACLNRGLRSPQTTASFAPKALMGESTQHSHGTSMRVMDRIMKGYAQEHACDQVKQQRDLCTSVAATSRENHQTQPSTAVMISADDLKALRQHAFKISGNVKEFLKDRASSKEVRVASKIQYSPGRVARPSVTRGYSRSRPGCALRIRPQHHARLWPHSKLDHCLTEFEPRLALQKDVAA